MKIRITKASKPTYWYADKIGEVFDVVEHPSMSEKYRTDEWDEYGGRGLVNKCDCEVINEIKTEANEMKSLKEIVEQLVSCGYTCEAGPLENNVDFRTLAKIAGVEMKATIHAGETIIPAQKSPRQIRDEIIEKAKCDLIKLKIIARDDYAKHVKFFINKEKRTVAALLVSRVSRRVFERGIAKCDPTDCFNVHIGKAIALRRALGLEIPDEYLNAPQPTEVRVGDVVSGGREQGYYSEKRRFTLSSYDAFSNSYPYEEDKSDWIYATDIGRIIDDSREGDSKCLG